MRRIPLSHRSHMIGFQALPTGSAEHESALERDFVTLASFRDAGARIISQPMTIRFTDNGRHRRYTPDFEVRRTDGRIEIVEIKYRSDLRIQWVALRPCFAAMRSWAQDRGASFLIVTEREIRNPMLETAKRLLPLRGTPFDPIIAATAHAMVGEHGLSFGELVLGLSAPRSAALGTIWRMLACGELRTDFAMPVLASSRIFRT